MGTRDQPSYATLIKNISGAVYRCGNDPDWTVEFISDGCIAITGYQPDEIVGNRVTSLGALILPEDVQPVRGKCQANLAAHKACSNEYRITHRNGEVRWIWDQAQGIYSESGVLLHIEGLITDITERKRGEAKLAASESRLRAIINNEPECVKLLAADGSLIEMNPAGLRMIEADSFDQVANQCVYPQIVPEHRAKYQELIERVFRGESGTLEFQFVGLKGTTLWLETHATPLRDDHGKITSLLGITRDITTRKRAEQRLAAFASLGRRLNAAVDVQTAGRIIVEVADELLGWDACTLDLYDAGTDQIRPVLNMDLVNGERTEVPPAYSNEKPSPGLRRVMEDGAKLILREELEGMTPGLVPFGDFSRPSASLMFVPVRDGQKVIGVLSIHSYRLKAYTQADLDALQALADQCGGALERIQSRESQRASEAKYRTLVESASDGIFVSDLQGRLLDSNAAGCRMFGYTREELLRMSNKDMIADEEKPRMAPEMARLSDGEVMHSEWQCRRKNGTVFPGEVSSTALPDGRVLAILRDGTERKRAEEELRLMQFGVEHAGDGVFWLSPDGRMLYVNESACCGLGYSREELLGKTIFDLDPDYQPGVWEPHWKELKRSRTLTFETRHRTKTGHIFPIEVNANYVNVNGREFNFAFTRDITERRRAEADLRQSEARLRLSTAASNIGLWDWNLLTNDTYFSREWKAQIGYAEDEIASRFEEWQCRVHPEDLAPMLAKVQRFIEDPASDYAVEFRLRHKDGSYRWIFTEAQIFRDAAGKLLRMIGCHIDITERKRAEETLHVSEMRHRLMAETILAYAFAYRVEPDGTPKLDWATSPVMQVLGFSEAEMKGGVSFLSLIHPDDYAVQQAALNRVMNGHAEILEIRVSTRAGQLRWLRNHLRPEWSDAEQRVVRIYGAAQDITDLKRAEEDLRRLSTQLLRSQDEERRRIARELHDNTAQLLAALAMNLSSLQNAVAGKAGAERTLADSLSLTDRAAQEIRTLSYLLHPPVLEEVGLVGALRDYAGGLAKRSGVKIQVEADEAIGRLAKDEEMALFRVTQEALGNIVRHSGSATATIRLARRKNEICLEVEDCGGGIPPETLQRVRSAAAELGVGIAGMRERMRQLGGQLEIDSDTGGTTVRAVLPV